MRFSDLPERHRWDGDRDIWLLSLALYPSPHTTLQLLSVAGASEGGGDSCSPGAGREGVGILRLPPPCCPQRYVMFQFLLKVGSVLDLSSVRDPPVPLCPSCAAAPSFHGIPLPSFSSDTVFIEWKTQEGAIRNGVSFCPGFTEV